MKKNLTLLLAILLVSVFILSSCEIPGLGGSNDEFVEHLQGQIDKLEEELSNAEKENKEKDKEIANLKAEMSALRAEISSLKALDTENKGKIAALEADYAAKVAEIESNKKANEEALAALEAVHKAEVEGLEGNIAELETAYNNKVAELEANKQANEEALVALEAEHKAAIEALEAENANLALQIAELEARIEELLKDKDYIVTFNVNGGEGSVEDQTARYKKTVDEPTAPTKAHYDFLGWYVGGVKVEFPYVVTANTEFVAEYAPTKYTVSYVVNDGTMLESYVAEYDVETSVTLPTPTRDLYLFDGWYEDVKFEGEKVREIKAGEFGNRTFYAKWLSTTNGITYQLSNDGTYYTVTGYDGSDTVIVIPDSVGGIPVTKIADNAFKGKQRITSITVPDSVTSIGDYAFSGCISLTELNLGNGIKTIPECMAHGCNKLQGIVIPDSVTSIGYRAFYDCDSLESVVIGDSVISIGGSAFSGCSSLESVVIGDSVTSIGERAFYNCDSLVSVVIGDSVTSIGERAFEYCDSLASVTIPDSVSSIGEYAFNSCDSLYVVYNNSDLLLEIGSTSNGYLVYYAKILVDNGETIDRDDGYNYTLTDDGFLFREKGSKYELIAYAGGEVTVTLPENINGNSYDLYYMRGVVNVIIPESFTTINDSAFRDCSSLESVVIGDSVTSIGSYAFEDCSSLESVVIGDSVTSIGSQAFNGCSSLESVTIPDSVEFIGEYAFYNCSSLESVTIPDSVTSISGYAFDGCSNLTEVYYNGSAAEWNSIYIYSYGNDPLKNATRYYYSENQPTEEGNFWHWVDGEVVIWPDYVEPELIPTPDEYFEFTLLEDGTYSIEAKDVNNMPSEVVIPSTYDGKAVTTIGEGAFMYCSSLVSVTIPDSVTSIGDSAFYGCASLYVVYNSSDLLLEIGSSNNGYLAYYAKILVDNGETIYANDGYNYTLTDDGFLFREKDSKYELISYVGGEETVTLPENINGNSYDLYYMRGVVNVIIPESFTTINDSAFSDCDSLVSVTIPDSVEFIGSYAFDDCDSLESVIIPDSVTSIGDSAFYGCASLESVVIGASVTYIGDEAFAYCDSLTSIMVDGNNQYYKSIDGNLYTKDGKTLIQYAISKVDTSFEIPYGVTSIGNQAFRGCSNLVSVTIPDSVTSIGSWAFAYCDSFESVVIPDSVTSIGDSAFFACSSLESVTIPDSVEFIDSSAFACCYSLESVTIPDSVTSIGSYAFWNCYNLTSVVIGDSVTSIGNEAFNYCSSLYVVYNYSDLLFEIGSTNNGCVVYYAKILVDNGETIYANDGYNYTLTDDGFLFREKDSKYELICYVGDEDTVTLPENINGNSYDLYYMRGVINVIIPEGFTAINDYAFYGCSSLESVTIPDSVTSIGSHAFAYCYSLTSIIVDENNEYYKSIDGNLYSKDGKTLIQYAIGKKDTSFEIPYGVTSIGFSAFSDCDSLVSVTIPDSVTSIGSHAFYDCDSLESVVIGDSVTSIGSRAFYHCSSLESVVIGDSVTSIGGSAFYHCSSLVSVVIGDSVASIGNYAFYDCSSLVSVTIPDSVTSIGQSAFEGCSSLESVVIGDSVKSIGGYAFNNCSSLTEVYYNGSAAEWNSISISYSNAPLNNATRYYYSENQPTEEGNFWHWVDGEVVIW